MTKTILFIHQSVELYGSDKTLFFLVKGIMKNNNFNVVVALPGEGPLKKLLEKNNIKVIVTPVINISRKMFTLKHLLSLPFYIASSIKKLKKELGDLKIDIIHSSTLAVLLGAFYSKKYKINHIWHIHEIIEKPKAVSYFFAYLVNHFSNVVVFNSNASKQFLCKKLSSLQKKSIVVLN
jgi:hypothetical protein